MISLDLKSRYILFNVFCVISFRREIKDIDFIITCDLCIPLSMLSSYTKQYTYTYIYKKFVLIKYSCHNILCL